MSDEQKVQACAQAAHEVNRAYCAAIGDHSQESWDNAPAWQRASAINGVRGISMGNKFILARKGTEERVKDDLYVTVVRAMAAALGLEVAGG